jgi:hypothetical protein
MHRFWFFLAVVFLTLISLNIQAKCQFSNLQEKVLIQVRRQITQNFQKRLAQNQVSFYPETLKIDLRIKKGPKKSICIFPKLSIVSGFQNIRVLNESNHALCSKGFGLYRLKRNKNCSLSIEPTPFYQKRKIPYYIVEDIKTRNKISYIPLSWPNKTELK